MIPILLRAFISVIIGYVSIAGLVVMTDALVGGIFHGARTAFTIVNLATAFPFAVVGGFIAASISKGNEMWAAWGVVAVSVTLSIVTLISDPGRLPIWYWASLLALLVTGVLTGGTLRKRYPRNPTLESAK